VESVERYIQVLKALEAERVEYILIGGIAVILHGLPRFTEDIDILMKVDEENVERLKRALRRVFDDPSIDEIAVTDLMEYAVVRYGSPGGFYVDLIARVGEVADYSTVASEVMEIDGNDVRVATAEALYRMKHDTVRPKDQADALFLKGKIQYLKRKGDR
jgi:hypothetical protein